MTNAILVDLDPPAMRRGWLRIEDGTIRSIGEDATAGGGGDVHDCHGAVVLPGLVNGHTHLYSALAVGMPPPDQAPEDFLQILQRVWWKLDLALDERSILASGLIGSIEALRCGTTTLIDHHASPNCIGGSLDLMEQAMERVGLRGVLCYEVTDRNGQAGRDAGLAETARYLELCQKRGDGQFAGLVGGHALFTLEDDTLNDLRDLANDFDVGVHIHLAEDTHDEEVCTSEHQLFLGDRLRAHGLLRRDSLFAHGTHLTDNDIEAITRAGCTLAHNTRSNMNNAVGYAPIPQLWGRVPVCLGTDGIGSDMLAEARTAWFKLRDERTGLGPDAVLHMLANSARRASQSLDLPFGRLEPEYAADLVVTDYYPATPVTGDNVLGHLLFALGSRHVKDVMIGGQWRMKDRCVLGVDEAAERHAAVEIAGALWGRM